MARKAKRKAYHHGDLRAALLEAAVAEIADKGLHGLSLRECARRAGVSHAAPYRHFADKDALLVAIAEEGFSMLSQAGRAAMEGLDDPRARLDAYGIAYVRFAVTYPSHFRVMFTSELDDPDPLARAAGERAFSLLVDSAAAVAGPESAELAGVAFWTVPHGLAMLMLDGRMPPEHTATPEAAAALAAQVLGVWRETSR